MRVSIRKNLSSISMCAGLGGVAFLVYGPLYTCLVGFDDGASTRAPPTSLAFPSVLIGIAAAGIGVVSLVRRYDRLWKAVVGLVLGLAPVIFTADAWLIYVAPGVSLDDLRATRDRAIPIIEKQTGLTFKASVPVEVGSSEAMTSKLQEDTRSSVEDPRFVLPFDYLALYDQDAKTAYVFPDGIRKLQRQGVLASSRARAISRAVLVGELVHALDDQNGMIESKAELVAILKAEPNRFWIRRAIHEGRSSYYGRKVCAELGIGCLADFMVQGGGQKKDPGVIGEMLLDQLSFIYGDGARFFEWLGKAGRTDLISKASAKAPLWLHHIERPDVYARDVDSGMDEVFRESFSRLPGIFPAAEWRASWSQSWGLVEHSRRILLWEPSSDAECEFMGLAVAEWGGSFGVLQGEGWVGIQMWRFPNEGTADKGFNLRRAISLESASRYGEKIEPVQRECPGARRYIFEKRTTEDEEENVKVDFRCLGQRGEFLLAAKFRNSITEDRAKAIAEKLVRELLLPLGQATGGTGRR